MRRLKIKPKCYEVVKEPTDRDLRQLVRLVRKYREIHRVMLACRNVIRVPISYDKNYVAWINRLRYLEGRGYIRRTRCLPEDYDLAFILSHVKPGMKILLNGKEVRVMEVSIRTLPTPVLLDVFYYIVPRRPKNSNVYPLKYLGILKRVNGRYVVRNQEVIGEVINEILRRVARAQNSICKRLICIHYALGNPTIIPHDVRMLNCWQYTFRTLLYSRLFTKLRAISKVINDDLVKETIDLYHYLLNSLDDYTLFMFEQMEKEFLNDAE